MHTDSAITYLKIPNGYHAASQLLAAAAARDPPIWSAPLGRLTDRPCRTRTGVLLCRPGHLRTGRDLRLGDQRYLPSLAACLLRVRPLGSCAGPAPQMREELTTRYLEGLSFILRGTGSHRSAVSPAAQLERDPYVAALGAAGHKRSRSWVWARRLSARLRQLGARPRKMLARSSTKERKPRMPRSIDRAL